MLVAGNWKMNMDLAAARQLASGVVSAVGDPGDVDVAICPPFVSLDATFSVLHGSRIRLGAQNMHEESSGAYTGEVSAPMLRAVGCHYVILGHSERRAYFGETDEAVCAKVRQALDFRLVPIVCVGEKLEERDEGRAKSVVEKQLRKGLQDIDPGAPSNLVIAYEPVWAIGTGRTASPEQAQEMHAHIRALLADLLGGETASDVDILYGGSVKPGNAAELFAGSDVDGGLIGGASLNAEDFAAIVRAAGESL
ncbi:MAG: triose-phosphate isomerase [Rhodothermales bacterium]|nr:triose-phosphate isomerase [Rhodothermales bacterium]